MSVRREYSRNFRMIVLSITIVLVAVLIAGCSSGFTPQAKEKASATQSFDSSASKPTNGRVQSSDGGAVTIDVEWQGEEKNSLVFEVSMNTHSVDLDQYELNMLAVLRDNAGNEYRPLSWDSSPGGHHRRGTLTFPLPDSLSQGATEYLEIWIRDVAGIKERVFNWEL